MFLNIKSQLPPGTKLLANCQGWFNGKDGRKHRANVCQSDDPQTVHKQVLAAHAAGIDGFIPDWYGASPDYAEPTDRFVQLLFQETAKLGMEVSIMVDSGTFKYAQDHTLALGKAMAYVRQKYIPQPNYTKINGKPVLWEFSWANAKMDVSAFAKNNSDLTVLTQTHTAANCAGSYAWVNGFTSPDAPRNYIHEYLASKDALQVPCIFDGFDDSNPVDPKFSIWDGGKKTSPARKIAYGQWQMCIDAINASPKKFPAVQICTWNDYDEGTRMEPHFLALAGLKIF